MSRRNSGGIFETTSGASRSKSRGHLSASISSSSISVSERGESGLVGCRVPNGRHRILFIQRRSTAYTLLGWRAGPVHLRICRHPILQACPPQGKRHFQDICSCLACHLDQPPSSTQRTQQLCGFHCCGQYQQSVHSFCFLGQQKVGSK